MRPTSPKRTAKPKYQCKLMCCTLTEEAGERVTASIAEWEAGRQAEINDYGPACHCGLRGAKEPCTRHGERDPVAGASG